MARAGVAHSTLPPSAARALRNAGTSSPARRTRVEELERALESSEARYSELFDKSPRAMWIYDIETRAFERVNKAMVALYGYSPEDLAQMTVDDLAVPGDGDPHGRTSRHRVRGGEIIHVEMTTHDLSLDGQKMRVVVAEDVTSRHREDGVLLESDRRFRALLENARMVAVILDLAGRVTFCNDFLLDLTGYERHEVIGRDYFDLFVPEDQRAPSKRSYAKRIGDATVAPHIDLPVLTKRGDAPLIAFSNTVLRDESGAPSGMASIGTDVTEQRRATEKLEHDALHDQLTGLPNRTLFVERLEGAIARAKRKDDYVFAVLFVDLDRFKIINDSLGHSIGDQLLREAGLVLRACVRPEDTVARLGGDEFTILLDDVGDVLHASRIADKIHHAFGCPFSVGGHEAFTTASIGIALSPTGYDHAEDVLRDADIAMYRAKARGKSRHEIFDKSMHARAVALQKLETDLRRAVDRDEFMLEYQPIVALPGGNLVGFEALLRWRHRQRGMVPPGEFVSVAEETGLILPIGAWVLREACAQMRTWLSETNAPLSISVNLSTKQFLHGDLSGDIDRALKDAKLDPKHLKLELTESVLMENAETAATMLQGLRSLGIQLSIDDFGTGYSSLSYLLRFPVDTLKIDRSFVHGMGVGADQLELVRAIVTLARNLGMDVVAEGVETEGQRIRLEALGCQYAQGYLFSKPLDAATASHWVSAASSAIPPLRRGSVPPRT